MREFQMDWNKSLTALLTRQAREPPIFKYDAAKHQEIKIAMSDATDFEQPDE